MKSFTLICYDNESGEISQRVENIMANNRDEAAQIAISQMDADYDDWLIKESEQ